jgi:hypothetical protein
MKRRFAIALSFLFFLTAAKCPPLRSALKTYGYVELKPPSQLMGPGTLVWVSDKEPFTAGVICSADKVLGADWRPTESPTMNTELAKTAKRGVNFKVDLAQIVTGNGKVDHIKDVSMSLKNAKLFEVTDYDVEQRSNTLDCRCLRALQRRQRAGFTVTMIQSSLQADVTYHIRWENTESLDVQAKIAQLEQLAVSLGLNNSTVTDKTISADSLYWGIRADDFLAWMYSPDNIKQADHRGSVFEPEGWDGNVVDKEDSVSTTSGGDMPTLSDTSSENGYWQQIDATDDGPKAL